MAEDGKLIGNVVNNLPIEKMIAAPLTATIKAQSEMSMALANFIQSVGFDRDGNIRMVNFNYMDTQEGKNVERHIQAPFLAMTGLPNMAVEEVNIAFEMTVASAGMEKSDSSEKLDTTAGYKAWYSPVSASMTGSVSHSYSQTRSTDTRAKYSFNVTARKQGTPEALQRIIDAITDSVTRPQEGKDDKSNLIDGSVPQKKEGKQ